MLHIDSNRLLIEDKHSDEEGTEEEGGIGDNSDSGYGEKPPEDPPVDESEEYPMDPRVRHVLLEIANSIYPHASGFSNLKGGDGPTLHSSVYPMSLEYDLLGSEADIDLYFESFDRSVLREKLIVGDEMLKYIGNLIHLTNRRNPDAIESAVTDYAYEYYEECIIGQPPDKLYDFITNSSQYSIPENIPFVLLVSDSFSNVSVHVVRNVYLEDGEGKRQQRKVLTTIDAYYVELFSGDETIREEAITYRAFILDATYEDKTGRIFRFEIEEF